MPRGDRTGPSGMGPMTGRAAGYCAGMGMPGFASAAPVRGLGFGRGRGFAGGGRGWRNWSSAAGFPGRRWFGRFAASYSPPDPGWEKQMLKSQADALQTELDFINQRLSEMEASR